jgi:uncharacterized membrane protein
MSLQTPLRQEEFFGASTAVVYDTAGADIGSGIRIDWRVNEDRRIEQEGALWYWNTFCASAHLAQAIAVLYLGLENEDVKNFKLPLTTTFIAYNGKGFPRQDLRVRELLPFVAVASGFAWLSFLAHFLVVLSFSDFYIPDLRRGINKFRWIEYAFSSSLMIALIAMLFGMYDIISLVLLISLNATMNLFGYQMELLNRDKDGEGAIIDWSPFIFGCFAGTACWATIFGYVGGAEGVGDVPDFVWVVLSVYFFLFNIFALNMVLQYSRVGYWSDRAWGYRRGGYYFGEIVYQLLSLVAKTLLLWLVFAGTNQPNVYK